MKTSSMMVGLVTIATMLALAVPAQAVLVQNLTSGQTVFKDTFEDATGVPTTTLAPQKGTWAGSGGVATNNVSPGPFGEGTQYYTTQYQTIRQATLSSVQNSGTVKFSTKLYSPTHPNFQWIFQFNDSGGSPGPEITVKNNRVQKSAAGGEFNLFVTDAKWETVAIEYVLGASQMTVSVDGASETGSVGAQIINDLAFVKITQAHYCPVRSRIIAIGYDRHLPGVSRISL